MKRPKNRKISSNHINEKARIGMVDDINEFIKFRQEILPWLRTAIERGATAEEIYQKAQALAAARSVTIAMTEVDSGKAMNAVKEILDRSQGKPKERVELTKKYEGLTDDELDAMLLSEAEEASKLANKEEIQ